MITPYYFYICDMIPISEHWRLSLARAQQLQHEIMGYLPGFATPRIVCDVPFVGKRWVHQAQDYDQRARDQRLDEELPDAAGRRRRRTRCSRTHHYYDPIDTLPAAGAGVVAPARRPGARRRRGAGAGRGQQSGRAAAGRVGLSAAFRATAGGPRRAWTARSWSGSPRRLGPDPGQQALQVGGRGHPHLQDVVLLAGHGVAGLDLRHHGQPVGHVVRGAGVQRGDRDERRQRQARRHRRRPPPCSRGSTPRCSSRRTRWCTADVDSPVARPRSVKLIRPS